MLASVGSYLRSFCLLYSTSKSYAPQSPQPSGSQPSSVVLPAPQPHRPCIILFGVNAGIILFCVNTYVNKGEAHDFHFTQVEHVKLMMLASTLGKLNSLD